MEWIELITYRSSQSNHPNQSYVCGLCPRGIDSSNYLGLMGFLNKQQVAKIATAIEVQISPTIGLNYGYEI